MTTRIAGERYHRQLRPSLPCLWNIFQELMGDLAADHPAWWRWAYLRLWQSSSQLQMISPTLARWRWAYLGSAMLKPAKSLINSLVCWFRTNASALIPFQIQTTYLTGSFQWILHCRDLHQASSPHQWNQSHAWQMAPVKAMPRLQEKEKGPKMVTIQARR